MKYKKIEPKDFESWVKMGLMLWPKSSKKEVEKEFKKILVSKKESGFICIDENEYIAFINVSARNENVAGAKSYPVGYVEAIFVKNKYRKKGIGKQLIKYGEEWAKKKGCKEMASDTWSWNKKSQEFHEKLGFKKHNILVHFIKKI